MCCGDSEYLMWWRDRGLTCLIPLFTAICVCRLNGDSLYSLLRIYIYICALLCPLSNPLCTLLPVVLFSLLHVYIPTCTCWVCCVALPCCLFASFFLPSHLSLKHVYPSCVQCTIYKPIVPGICVLYCTDEA